MGLCILHEFLGGIHAACYKSGWMRLPVGYLRESGLLYVDLGRSRS